MTTRIEVAIGDIHGRFDKFQELLDLLNAKYDTTPKMLVMLGDYVDRGPQSAQVVEYLRDMSREPAVKCIKGNHEDLMIQAVLEKYNQGLWDINGGHATIDSYELMYGADYRKTMEEDAAWLKALPTIIQTEHRIYVHAGLNPRRRDLSDQRDEEVMWIRDPWLQSDYDWGKHVVHGHTHTWGRKKIGEVEQLPNRTNLDTGAFYTGVLSAAIFDADLPGGPIEIIQTQGN